MTTSFLTKESEIVAIRSSIMRDMDVLVEFVQNHQVEGHEQESDAAARVETYLRDIRAAELKQNV